MSERIVLDPAAVADPGRTEIVLTDDAGAIRIASEGPSWGEATVETFMAEAEYGSSPVDRTYPTRTPEIPLLILDTDDVSFDQGRRQLQEWVGLVQETGRGWIERETANGSIYYDVVRATLRLGGDSLQAWGQVDANAALQLEVLPDGYGDEVLLGSARLTGGGVVRLPDVPGDWSARMRAVIRDTSGNPQRSLVYAIRPAEAAATAGIDWAATALTRLSGSARTDHVAYSSLPPTWVAVLSTDVSGVGAMTHVGPHRIWALVETPTAGAQVRLEWAGGSSLAYEQKAIVTLPSGATWVDLGQVQIPRATVGAQQWQGRILANASSLRIYRVRVVPTAYASGVVNASTVVPTGSSVGAWDDFETYTGVLDGNSANGGGRWSGAGASATAIRASSGTAGWSGRDGGRYAVLLGSSFTTTDMQANVNCAAIPRSGSTESAGGSVALVARYLDVNNWIMGGYRVTRIKGGAVASHQASITMSIGGVVSYWDGVSVGTAFSGGALRFIVVDGSALLFLNGVLVVAATSVAALATGGVLQRGSPGLYASGGSSSSFGGGSASWDNFFVASSGIVSVDDAVLFGNQQAQLTSSGYSRADSAGAAHAPLTPIGTLPRVPGPAAELFVASSRALPGQPLPSTAGGDLTVDVYGRPCYLFSR